MPLVLASRSRSVDLASSGFLEKFLRMPGDDRFGHLVLIGLIVQPAFFSGLEMKAVSIRMKGMSGALSTAIRPVRHSLCPAIDAANFTQHGLAQFQAVADGGRLRQVEQGLGQHRVLDRRDVDATDQVSGIFLLREVTRRRNSTRRSPTGRTRSAVGA